MWDTFFQHVGSMLTDDAIPMVLERTKVVGATGIGSLPVIALFSIGLNKSRYGLW